VLRVILLLVGSFTLTGLIWHIGPSNILSVLSSLGPTTLALILVPSVVMYLLDTIGWRCTLARHATSLSYWRLFLVRTAGEAVNFSTPTAYVGGEPLKAHLLTRWGVPMVDGLASVVTAKTTMTIAQVLFILIGIALAFGYGGLTENSEGLSVAAGALSVGLLVFGTVLFVTVQRRGLFLSLLGLLRRVGLRLQALESRESQLRDLDRTILKFYGSDRQRFLLSTVFFFLGWLAEASEVFLMLVCLGGAPDVLGAIAIAALSVFIKGSTFFIPGSLGAQDGGNLVLLTAFGYSELTGISFALLRRFRELVWIFIGLQGRLVHQAANRKVRHQQAVEFLFDEFRRLASQHNLGSAQMSLQLVQSSLSGKGLARC
jgi:glycosyltransferase 2 family protein